MSLCLRFGVDVFLINKNQDKIYSFEILIIILPLNILLCFSGSVICEMILADIQFWEMDLV